MSEIIRYEMLKDLYPDELTLEEMIYVHLDLHSVYLKDRILISTLSVIHRNINSVMEREYSKTLMPILSMLAILDQLGVCYNRKDKLEPNLGNGIKRCLYYFGEFNESDEIIDTLYALRNGLMHNISLSSYNRNSGQSYYFVFDNNLQTVYKKADLAWDGSYESLDGTNGEYSTSISVPNLKKLVDNCINKASKLNESANLELRLQSGIKQLYFDYIRYNKLTVS